MMDEETRIELQPLLAQLKNPVQLAFFTQKHACPACENQQKLLEALTALTDKIRLRVYDFVQNSEEARNYKIDKIPATAILGSRDYGIRFYGLTLGYEFTSLIEAILMASTEQTDLDPQLQKLIQNINQPVHIQVMATLTCPYCPKMVHTADQFALANPNIRADMVDAAEFPQLAQSYDVTSVPKTIINETHSFEGVQPPTALYLEILKTVNPKEYERLQEAIREQQGNRRAKKAEENHRYAVLIVGGGPAAMSAALYTARKDLDSALIAEQLGGQINYTTSIDNYLGIPGANGKDMAEVFRDHFERYPIAEAIGAPVTRIEKAADEFIATTSDNRRFRALSIIYCAGKEYRRLGVPGEDRFIGRGIGFCATCDAPLYRGKRVAVVGGGNSALTAARDLSNFASEVHLIHRRDEFKADESLIRAVSGARNITVHKPMVVGSFLGEDKLVGVRLESVDGSERLDLGAEGVFLEVGLTPNSGPLKGLVKLNEWDEVPVNRDQSTVVGGLFAAGDVTDVGEKQVCIAVGQGALAALSSYRYLVERNLIGGGAVLREDWQ